ncbi:hypothetical protein [Ornithinimicrobium sp. W1665]|uniref:hypothetical protein n=1 Tax=Ornithinimicrobium sp. W1665 TaxID=3416666 RepID=UPI003D6C5873
MSATVASRWLGVGLAATTGTILALVVGLGTLAGMPRSRHRTTSPGSSASWRSRSWASC